MSQYDDAIGQRLDGMVRLLTDLSSRLSVLEAKLDALAEPLENFQKMLESIKESPYAGMLGMR